MDPFKILANLGAWLIDRSGRRAVLLADTDSCMVFKEGSYVLHLPVFSDQGVAADEETGSAGMLLSLSFNKMLMTALSNPTLYESMVDAGLEVGMDWPVIDTIAREFCGFIPRADEPFLGDGGFLAEGSGLTSAQAIPLKLDDGAFTGAHGIEVAS